MKATLSGSYFDALYAASDDPWSFDGSAYETEKYARSLGALRERYARGLEIGCSIGIFTRGLAERCDTLTAVDVSARALELARERCRDAANVTFARCTVPRAFPAGTFDLIAACEVGYYWSDADLATAIERIAAGLEPGGDLLLVHYLPFVAEHVRSGDAVHEAFLRERRFAHVRGERADRYRLDLLRRC